MAYGPIIFLNGTSSAGKTSIARELLVILDAPYLHLSLDTFLSMRTPRAMGAAQWARVLEQIVSGFHHAIAAMALAGNHLIVDHVLDQPHWLHECLHVLAPFDVLFVGVQCSLAEVERREYARGNRMRGLAAQQINRVHQHQLYDVACDTSTHSA